MYIHYGNIMCHILCVNIMCHNFNCVSYFNLHGRDSVKYKMPTLHFVKVIILRYFYVLRESPIIIIYSRRRVYPKTTRCINK